MLAFSQPSDNSAPPLARSTVYYLVWRVRASLPWQSEEFESRFAAHQRYFALLERGCETYLQSRVRRLAA